MRNVWQTQPTDTNDKWGQLSKLIAFLTAATESNDSPATNNGGAAIVGFASPENRTLSRRSVTLVAFPNRRKRCWVSSRNDETWEARKDETESKKGLHRSWLVIGDSQPPHKAHSVLLLTAPARRSLVLSSIHTVPSLPSLPPFPLFSTLPHPAGPLQPPASFSIKPHDARGVVDATTFFSRLPSSLRTLGRLEIGYVLDAASLTHLKAYQASSMTHATGSVPQLLIGLLIED